MSIPNPNALRGDKPSITILEFFVDFEEERDAKGAKIPGTAVEVHKVRWRPRGDNKSENIQKVARIKKHEPILWEAIERPYERWRSGQAEPADGMALSAWSGVNKAQVEKLRLLGLLTVEHVAEMTGNALQAYGSGGVALKTRAQQFLASRPQAQLIEDAAQKDEQIKALVAQVQELTRTVNQLSAEQPETPRRGRKAEAA
ncbi:MAG TPA: hypothetical protein VEA41_22655 [Salinarimonas sp.]|nr:hypothetical protein [Salinarimonas sp.]